MFSDKMFYGIDDSEKWSLIEEVKRGWSSDKKFYVETDEGTKLLLRISHIDRYEAKEKEYEIIKLYSTLGFTMSQPLSFGICNDNKNVFMLLTWVEGKDLEVQLSNFSSIKQYELGREAGLILRKIHSIPVAENDKPVQTKQLKKEKQLQAYINSSHRIADDETMIQFIQNNLNKLWNQPPVYQHGDYHPGNLILTPEGKIGVIDFNRWEVGDPYEEFYKLESFATEVSIPYCIGQIDAYFQDKVPDEFWDTLAVYVAHASLYSIKWAEKFGQKDIDHMTKICYKAIHHYEGFQRRIPRWYDDDKTAIVDLN